MPANPTQTAVTTRAEAIRQAMALHRSGKLDDAARIYRAVLQALPDDVDALHLLGVLLNSKGETGEGIGLIQRAVEVHPDFAVAHNNLGTALLRAKRPQEAIASFERAVALKGDFAEAHSNLGNALAELGRFGEAAECHQRAVVLKPDYAEGHNNLGNALLSLGQFEEAAAACRRAIELRPKYAKAHNNLGIALARLQRHEEAAASFRRAIAVNPAFTEAYRGLADALMAARRPEEAASALRRAIAGRPDDANLHNALGHALSAMRQMDAATASYRRAIALDPANGYAHHNLGNALLAAGRLDEAAASYRHAAGRLSGDCHSLLQYVHVCGHMCAWRQSAAETEDLLKRARSADFNGPPFPLLAVADDPALQHEAARAYVRHGTGTDLAPLWAGERYDHRKIRLAYFSFDFREHPAARLIAELLERHDRTQFEVYGISTGPDDDSALRRRIAGACDRFVDVHGLSDAAIARKLRELETGIVVDLHGHTEGSRTRALAWRPAPVQVAYLGYPATSGATFLDYVIADRFAVPDGGQANFTENIVHLPDTFQACDSTRPAPPAPGPRAAHGLPDAAFVFCCFNHTYKIMPAVFDVWMRVLAAVPGSVLWLTGDNRWAEANLKEEARSRGIDPARLVFAPRVDYAAFLSRLGAADLFLDTFPYNGGATVNDALWCGLPVVTCAGRSFVARMAGSLLRAAGMPELVTHTPADYEALALGLAQHPDRLAAAREKLAHNRTAAPLFDTGRFTMNIEAAYAEMWRASQAGEPPSPFSIEAAQD